MVANIIGVYFEVAISWGLHLKENGEVAHLGIRNT